MRPIIPARNGFEEGLEAGRQVAGSWKPSRLTLPEKWREATIEASGVICAGKRDLSEILADMARWSREDALDYAPDLHRRKMGAFPDLKTFPELEDMDQYEDEYPRGYAEGAGIDIREVLLEKYHQEIYLLARGGGRLSEYNCSECYVPNTPNGPMLGLGRDDIMSWYTDDPFGVSWPPAVEQQSEFTDPFQANPDFGICLAPGGGARFEYEEDRAKTLFSVPVLQLVQDYCTNTEEAVEMLIRYNDYWGPCNLVVGDAEGDGALFEKSKYDYGVCTGKNEVLTSTYGGCDDERMRSLCDTDSLMFKYYERRVGTMREILADGEANGGINDEVFWRAMLNHNDEGAGCQHRETMPEGVELFTHVAYYYLPAEKRSFRRAIASDNGHVLYPCQVPVVEVRS